MCTKPYKFILPAFAEEREEGLSAEAKGMASRSWLSTLAKADMLRRVPPKNVKILRPLGRRASRLVAGFVLVTFFTTTVLPPQALAQATQTAQAGLLGLPAPGTVVPLSAGFIPAILRGIKIYPEAPLRFDFIVDSGETGLKEEALKAESEKLIRYFLAALTVPEDELWVNLSPYEKDRIVPDELGKTEMGRDMLAQDYLLKQITASLIDPQGETGKKFWDRIYKQAYEKFGTTSVPVDTFNKVWIMPDKAEIYVKGDRAFVVEARLRVMLEEDYLAMEKGTEGQRIKGVEEKQNDKTSNPLTLNPSNPSSISSSIVREIVIPELEREVNVGKNFAQLRQIYNSLILAHWFKTNLKNAILNKVYSDKRKIAGLKVEDRREKGESASPSNAKDLSSPLLISNVYPPTSSDPTSSISPLTSEVDQIYTQYLAAFKKGVCNYIKVEYDEYTQKNIPRKYFSGGMNFGAGIESAVSVTSSPTTGQRLGRFLKKAALIAVMTVALSSFLGNDAAGRSQDISKSKEAAMVADTGSQFQAELPVQDEPKLEGPPEDEEDIDPASQEIDIPFASHPYDYIRSQLHPELDTLLKDYQRDVENHPWYREANAFKIEGFVRRNYSSYDYYYEPNNIKMKIYVIPIRGLEKNTGGTIFSWRSSVLASFTKADLGSWNPTHSAVFFVDEGLAGDKDFVLKHAPVHQYDYANRGVSRFLLSVISVLLGGLVFAVGRGSYDKLKNRAIEEIYKTLSKERNVKPSVSLSGDSLTLKIGTVKVIVTRDNIDFSSFFPLVMSKKVTGKERYYFNAMAWLLPLLINADDPNLPAIKEFIWSCFADCQLDGPDHSQNQFFNYSYNRPMWTDSVAVLDFFIPMIMQRPERIERITQNIIPALGFTWNQIDKGQMTEDFVQTLTSFSQSIVQDIQSGKSDWRREKFLDDIMNKIDGDSARRVMQPFFDAIQDLPQQNYFEYWDANAKNEHLINEGIRWMLGSQIELSRADQKALCDAILVHRLVEDKEQLNAQSQTIIEGMTTEVFLKLAFSLGPNGFPRRYNHPIIKSYWPDIFRLIQGSKGALAGSLPDFLDIVLRQLGLKFSSQADRFIGFIKQHPDVFKSRTVKTLVILFEGQDAELVDFILKTSNAKLIEAFDVFTAELFSDKFSPEAQEYILRYFLKSVSRDKQLSFLREMTAWTKTGIMTENSAEEWKIFLEHYYQDFGPLTSADLFKVYKHLMQGKALDAPDVAPYALEKTIDRTGPEGIQEIKTQVDRLRTAIFKDETLTSEILTSPLLTALAAWLLRFSAGSWAHGVSHGRKLPEFFQEYQNASRKAPLLAIDIRNNQEQAIEVHKMGSIDFTQDEKDMFDRYTKLFTQALDIVKDKKQEEVFSLVQKEWIKYLQAKEAALSVLALEQQNPKARENIEASARKIGELVGRVADKKRFIDIEEAMIFNGNGFLRNDSDFEALFALSLILDAFIQYPAQQEKVKEILEDGLSVSALSAILTFKENLLKDHVLKDSEKKGYILNIFKTKIFKEALERREKLDDTLSLKIRPITRGLFLALAGSFGNACYTRIPIDKTLNHPTMVGAIPFAGDLGTGSGEEILGSVIVLENQDKDGNKIWILRAINPIEKIANDYNMDEFLRGLIKVVRKRAPQDVKGVYLTLVPGTTTNRPQVDSAAKRFASPKITGIRNKEDFNNYTISEVHEAVISSAIASDLTATASSDIKAKPGNAADGDLGLSGPLVYKPNPTYYDRKGTLIYQGKELQGVAPGNLNDIFYFGEHNESVVRVNRQGSYDEDLLGLIDLLAQNSFGPQLIAKGYTQKKGGFGPYFYVQMQTIFGLDFGTRRTSRDDAKKITQLLDFLIANRLQCDDIFKPGNIRVGHKYGETDSEDRAYLIDPDMVKRKPSSYEAAVDYYIKYYESSYPEKYDPDKLIYNHLKDLLGRRSIIDRSQDDGDLTVGDVGRVISSDVVIDIDKRFDAALSPVPGTAGATKHLLDIMRILVEENREAQVGFDPQGNPITANAGDEDSVGSILLPQLAKAYEGGTWVHTHPIRRGSRIIDLNPVDVATAQEDLKVKKGIIIFGDKTFGFFALEFYPFQLGDNYRNSEGKIDFKGLYEQGAVKFWGILDGKFKPLTDQLLSAENLNFIQLTFEEFQIVSEKLTSYLASFETAESLQNRISDLEKKLSTDSSDQDKNMLAHLKKEWAQYLQSRGITIFSQPASSDIKAKGVKLSTQEGFDRLLKDIAAVKKERNGPALIAVSGNLAVGKSIFAKQLVTAVEDAVLIHADDYLADDFVGEREDVFDVSDKGGFFDYERMAQEVRARLKENKAVVIEGFEVSRLRDYLKEHRSFWPFGPREKVFDIHVRIAAKEDTRIENYIKRAPRPVTAQDARDQLQNERSGNRGKPNYIFENSIGNRIEVSLEEKEDLERRTSLRTSPEEEPDKTAQASAGSSDIKAKNFMTPEQAKEFFGLWAGFGAKGKKAFDDLALAAIREGFVFYRQENGIGRFVGDSAWRPTLESYLVTLGIGENMIQHAYGEGIILGKETSMGLELLAFDHGPGVLNKDEEPVDDLSKILYEVSIRGAGQGKGTAKLGDYAYPVRFISISDGTVKVADRVFADSRKVSQMTFLNQDIGLTGNDSGVIIHCLVPEKLENSAGVFMSKPTADNVLGQVQLAQKGLGEIRSEPVGTQEKPISSNVTAKDMVRNINAQTERTISLSSGKTYEVFARQKSNQRVEFILRDIATNEEAFAGEFVIENNEIKDYGTFLDRVQFKTSTQDLASQGLGSQIHGIFARSLPDEVRTVSGTITEIPTMYFLAQNCTVEGNKIRFREEGRQDRFVYRTSSTRSRTDEITIEELLAKTPSGARWLGLHRDGTPVDAGPYFDGLEFYIEKHGSEGESAERITGFEGLKKFLDQDGRDVDLIFVARRASSGAKGGIDFNAKNMNVKQTGAREQHLVSRDGKELDASDQIPDTVFENIDLENIQGFVPVIINVTPVTNFNILLGLEDKDDLQLSSL